MARGLMPAILLGVTAPRCVGPAGPAREPLDQYLLGTWELESVRSYSVPGPVTDCSWVEGCSSVYYAFGHLEFKSAGACTWTRAMESGAQRLDGEECRYGVSGPNTAAPFDQGWMELSYYGKKAIEVDADDTTPSGWSRSLTIIFDPGCRDDWGNPCSYDWYSYRKSEGGANNDSDGDGVTNLEDNCPMTPNPDQADGDGDGVGRACDSCVEVFYDANAECVDDDGCCPAACRPEDDNECLCGNGTVDPGETCDTAIAPLEPGACPRSCDEGDNGALCSILERAGTCQAVCTTCAEGESCLGNATCARECVGPADCTSPCYCVPSIEGPSYCGLVWWFPPSCQRTSECPSGEFCSHEPWRQDHWVCTGACTL